mgnify:CR=1 FL=1|tara:strand:- start:1070 stop:1780 length:711 start_codon:yes stop_codon:yes gene_type:complete
MRILELGNYVAPAYAGMILAEQGHEVIKWHVGTDPILELNHGAELWAWINEGKTLERVNIKKANWHCLSGFDAVVDNFLPETLKSWRINPSALAAEHELAWVSMRSELPGRSFDVVAQARATLSHSPWIPFWIADTSAGLWMAFKILNMILGGRFQHSTLGQASCLAKLVEGELKVDRPPHRERGSLSNPYEVETYFGDPIHGACVEFRDETIHEPVRDHAWRLENLWHQDGRIII